METPEIKLPNIEKVKQETIEKAAAFKEKLKFPESQEIINLKESISKIPVPPKLHQIASSHIQDLINLPDADKVAKLVEIAFEKGPLTAITIAQKMNDAHILDALHDTLSQDNLFNKLVALGKL
jgi:hypothetical protein